MRKLFLLFILLFTTTIYGQDCTNLVVNMYDSYGDGWNGNTLSVGDNSVTLANGSEGTDTICVNLDECNTIEVGGGSYGSEVAWAIGDLAASYGNGIGSFLLGDGCITGCADESATNYNPAVDIVDNSLCEYLIPQGCTDEAACNYDIEAGQDDGSCEYPEQGFDCNGDCLAGSPITIGGGAYISETGVVIYNCDGSIAFESNGVQISTCLILPDAYTIVLTDSYGDGWNGNVLTIGDSVYTIDNGDELIVDGGCAVYGCTDINALNYNIDATDNDGSCEYPPCDGVVLLEATQQCLETPGGGQSLIVWSWVPMTDNPSCMLDQVYYGSTQVGPFIYPLGPGAQAAGNWGVYAGNGEMPPNWSEEHYFYAQLADGSFTDTAYFTPTPCILGCTDEEALNYNPWATEDDGECNNTTCGEGQTNISLEITLDQYPGETGWTLVDVSNGQAVESVPAGGYDFNQANSTITYNVCIPETGVELILSDAYGDGMAGSQWGGTDGNFIILGDAEPCGDLDTLWELEQADFGDAAYSGVIYLPACEIPVVVGCMDNSFVEFNPLAEESNPDDCITPKVPGCIDPEAYNYDESANTMQIFPMCDYTLTLEDDAEDGWGNSYIGVSQGDQVWTFTLGPGIASNSWNLPLSTNQPVNVYYFEIGGAQQPQAEVEFQTLHNSFTLVNSNGVELMSGGTNPFADNGQGALQSFTAPWFNYYSEIPFCGDVCIPKVYGCTDSESFNYNEDANTDDGSCITEVIGCTNDLAFNYNPDANVDDGSCQPVVFGCMDDIAWNYNFLANVEDGSCLYFGCTDEEALNYDETANVDNGACVYPVLGCIDPIAFNFNVDANVDDGSCIPVIIGCMDPTMWNYNEDANTGSDNCIPYIFGCTDITAYNWDPVANTDNGSCIPVLYGCTDPTAFNFDPLANTEDFSCVDVILGCTDPSALNYDPDANTEDFSCVDVLEGCMDAAAYNYDPIANSDDGSCLYDAGCVGDPGDPYWLNDSCYAWVINVDPNCCNYEWDIKCEGLYDYCQEQNGLDIDELLEEADIIIYPNPTNDMITIATNVQASIDVYDITGKLVIRVKEDQLKSKINQLDVSQLASGLYNFVITYNGKSINKKVIKQ